MSRATRQALLPLSQPALYLRWILPTIQNAIDAHPIFLQLVVDGKRKSLSKHPVVTIHQGMIASNQIVLRAGG